MNFLKQQRHLTRVFLQGEFRNQLRITGIAFLVLLVLGFITGLILPHMAEQFVGFLAGQMGDIAQQEGVSLLGLLLSNNLRASLFTVFYGLLPYIYLPALSLGMNSLVLGFFAAYYVNNGQSFLVYLAGIVPHGIFEIPALIFSIAMGLYLCQHLTDTKSRQEGSLLQLLQQLLRVYVLRVIPLLAIASVVEAFITPRLMQLFL